MKKCNLKWVSLHAFEHHRMQLALNFIHRNVYFLSRIAIIFDCFHSRLHNGIFAFEIKAENYFGTWQSIHSFFSTNCLWPITDRISTAWTYSICYFLRNWIRQFTNQKTKIMYKNNIRRYNCQFVFLLFILVCTSNDVNDRTNAQLKSNNKNEIHKMREEMNRKKNGEFLSNELPFSSYRHVDAQKIILCNGWIERQTFPLDNHCYCNRIDSGERK